MGGDTERTPHLEAARNSGIGGALSASELRFFAAAPGHRVSHETIYRTLFIHARGALKKELLQHLRRTRSMRRSRHHTQKTDIHGQIVVPCRSANALRLPKIALCLVTGTAI
jgi:IS30 family transposase